jgi:hypothetical protein
LPIRSRIDVGDGDGAIIDKGGSKEMGSFYENLAEYEADRGT